jgi:hypothetical protein
VQSCLSLRRIDNKDVLKEQRVCINYCHKLGKAATEPYEMLQQAFGETALSRSKAFDWYSRFKNGQRKRGKSGQMSRNC